MTRLRKIVTVLVLVPLAIALIVFAVANREIVTVSLDPFDAAAAGLVGARCRSSS